MNERSHHHVFSSTAEYYARYRPPFPSELYEAIESYFNLDGRGALLDLGTGTGQVALALSKRFERVVAIDVSEEMIETARGLAEAQGIDGITWYAAPAEEFPRIDTGPFRVVTIANALHWMDQPSVLHDCRQRVETGGGVALISMPGLINIDDTAGDEPWVQATAEVVKRHTGGERRAGSGVYRPPRRNWRDELRAAGFDELVAGSASYGVAWSFEEVLGYLYSTSFANRTVLDEQVDAFELDLRETLAAFDEEGCFPRRLRAEWVLGRTTSRR